MTAQNYLQIENNVVTNIVFWDGNPSSWMPPADATMLPLATTPAMVWVGQTEPPNPIFTLEQVIGAGAIGFTWDGSVLTTNQPQPK